MKKPHYKTAGEALYGATPKFNEWASLTSLDRYCYEQIAQAFLASEWGEAEQVNPDPLADAKRWQRIGMLQVSSNNDGNFEDWTSDADPRWEMDIWKPEQFRRRPEPVTVPLGPDDVPPGSAIRARELRGWSLICSAGIEGLVTITDGPSLQWFEWTNLLKFEINRNDGKGWVPCSKIKQE